MRLYTHPDCLLHDTGPGHPESIDRLRITLEALREAYPPERWIEAPEASQQQLLRVHSPAHIHRILDDPRPEPHRIDPDTVVDAHSARAALRAAGAACAAVDAAIDGDQPRAFCLVRPPGHHANRDEVMGFCLFNSVAVGAAQALAVHRQERVAIVDFDVHHGNGTQDIFWDEPRVFYLSSHQSALYPQTGLRDERGANGRNILNAPLPRGADGAALRRLYEQRLLPALDDFRPQLLLISAGFDAHKSDPLGGLLLDTDDFAWLTGELVAIARRHAGGRVVSVLEGGYDLDALRECCLAHAQALDDHT
jgi:acetoin utilization deacetylase AcuC-like enzyme